jgi:AcrR family transcriptional regulator
MTSPNQNSSAAAIEPDAASDVDPRVERSRSSVVNAAAQLLLADGPDAITHARVAAAAGVSRTTVYKHFPERSDLLFVTAQAIGNNVPNPDDLTGDLRTDLRMFLNHLATDLRDPVHTRVIAMMMERGLHDDAVALVRNTFMQEFRVVFNSITSAGVTSGELGVDVDVELGLASLAGSLIYSRLLADRTIDDALVDSVIDNFIRTNAPP